MNFEMCQIWMLLYPLMRKLHQIHSSNVFGEKLKHKAFSPKCINLANVLLLIALPRQVEDQGEGRAGGIKTVQCRDV